MCLAGPQAFPPLSRGRRPGTENAPGRPFGRPPRRRRRLDFGGIAVQALPNEISAVCGNPRRRMRSGSGAAPVTGVGAVDADAGYPDSRNGPPFPAGLGCSRSGGGQRLRPMVTSHLDDGEFARLIYEKIGKLIGPVFTASLERTVAAGGRVTGRRQSAQPVLACASHRVDGGAGAAAIGSLSVLWRRCRSRAADLRIHSPRNWTQRNRRRRSAGSRIVAGSGAAAGNCRRCSCEDRENDASDTSRTGE